MKGEKVNPWVCEIEILDIKKLLNLIWDAVMVGKRCQEVVVQWLPIEADGDIASEVWSLWLISQTLLLFDPCFYFLRSMWRRRFNPFFLKKYY